MHEYSLKGHCVFLFFANFFEVLIICNSIGKILMKNFISFKLKISKGIIYDYFVTFDIGCFVVDRSKALKTLKAGWMLISSDINDVPLRKSDLWYDFVVGSTKLHLVKFKQ